MINNPTERLQTFIAGQSTLLEMIASEQPLVDVLQVLVNWVEGSCEAAGGTFVLLQECTNNTVVSSTADSLSSQIQKTLHDVSRTGMLNPWATVQQEKQAVWIDNDESRWPEFTRLVNELGYKSLWIFPLLNRRQTFLGSISILQNTSGKPTENELQLLTLACKTAVLAIELDTNQKSELDAQKRVERAEETSRLAIEGADLGTFDMDVSQGTLEWSKRCREMFGIFSDNPISYEDDFLPNVHPDDLQLAHQAVEDAFNFEKSKGHYDVEYRTIGKSDKKLRWIRAKGRTIFSDTGEPVRLIGTALEITESKMNELRKNDFIAMVSHELKTPLTSIKSYVQMVLSKAKKSDDAFALNALSRAETQVNKMVGLIRGFLDTSRIQSGQMQLNVETFSLKELKSEIVDDIRAMDDSCTISRIGCPDIQITGDRDKIGQVLNNLLSNAIKYSPKGSTIAIGCQVTDTTVRVIVKDEGRGVPEEQQDRLFDRFYRVANDTTRNVPGFGIGLYLSAEIIKLHKGEIGMYNNPAPERGATFYFTLPYRQDRG
jgi:signal transduction histidine kinase